MTPFIQTLSLGPMDNLIYILGDPDTKDSAVVDPAWNLDPILETIDSNGFTLTSILLTHGHGDHTNAIDGLLAKHPDIPVYLSEKETTVYRPRNIQITDTKTSNMRPVKTLFIACGPAEVCIQATVSFFFTRSLVFT